MANKHRQKNYEKKISYLSKKLILLESDMTVLSDVNWKPTVKKKFEELNFKSIPQISPEKDYQEPTYDPHKKIELLTKFIEEVNELLGENDPVGHMLIRNANSWILAAKMMLARGTPEFYEISKKLFGSSEDVFFGTKLIDIAKKLDNWLTMLANKRRNEGKTEIPIVSSAEMAEELRKRLKDYFGQDIPVMERSDMSSDADAGVKGINIRKGAKFRLKDIGVFEVHEGWVHVGTARNGLKQPYMKFLSQPCPTTDIIQEGLGALTEIVTMNSYPLRARKVVDRVISINMAENGASFLEVYEWLKSRRSSEQADKDSAFIDAERVFHGGILDGGAPFTRDIIYLKGILQILKLLDYCITNNKLTWIPFLFTGNVTIKDVPVLHNLSLEGIVEPPEYVPSLFREDLDSLMIFLTHFSFIKNKLLR